MVKPADASHQQGQIHVVSGGVSQQPPQTSQGLAYMQFQGQIQPSVQSVQHLQGQVITPQPHASAQAVGTSQQMLQHAQDHIVPHFQMDAQVSPRSAVQFQAGQVVPGPQQTAQVISGQQPQNAVSSQQQGILHENPAADVLGQTITSAHNVIQDPSKAGGLPAAYSNPTHVGYGVHPHVPHLSHLQQMQQMFAMMHMSPYSYHQPSYYAHMSPYMQTMMQMSHMMHQLQQHQQQHGGQHQLPVHMTLPYYPGWAYPSTVSLPPQSSHPPDSASVPSNASPPRSPTSSRRNIVQETQSPYASIENLSLIGRSMPKSDFNILEQALAKTMSRQNHPHQHTLSSVSSGTNLQELAGETKSSDQASDVLDKVKYKEDKLLTDQGVLPDASPPIPTETRSEPDLSAPKVKGFSRFKVETVKDDPLLLPKTDSKPASPDVENSKTDVGEKRIEKRGRFQVTKIAPKPDRSVSSEGTSADATSAVSSNTNPNIIGVSKADSANPSTNSRIPGDGTSDSPNPASVSKFVLKVNDNTVDLHSSNPSFPELNSLCSQSSVQMPIIVSNPPRRRSVSLDHLYKFEKLPNILESSQSYNRLTHIGEGLCNRKYKQHRFMHAPNWHQGGKCIVGECLCHAADVMQASPISWKRQSPNLFDHRGSSQVRLIRRHVNTFCIMRVVTHGQPG